jgi:hypothetical protein
MIEFSSTQSRAPDVSRRTFWQTIGLMLFGLYGLPAIGLMGAAIWFAWRG